MSHVYSCYQNVCVFDQTKEEEHEDDRNKKDDEEYEDEQEDDLLRLFFIFPGIGSGTTFT